MPTKNKKYSGVVYSSSQGRMCPICGKTTSDCVCHRKSSSSKGDGIVRVGRETKGRKGKAVTVISGVAVDSDALSDLARLFKQKCGSGGTIKNGVIEIQGDHRDMLVEELTKQGYTVKRSCG